MLCARWPIRYIELQQEGTKALLTGSGDQAYRFTKGATKAEPFPPDAAFADSDFTREDLEPFRTARYKDARISDETGAELTVTLFPGHLAVQPRGDRPSIARRRCR